MLPRALRTAGASLARRAATPSVHVQRCAGVRAFASEAGDKRENPSFTATTVEDMQGLDASLLLKEEGTQKDASLRHFTVNFGPQHPAAHGVLRLIMELNGEEILRVDVRISCLGLTPAARRSAAPRHRKAHRIQDVHAGAPLL